MIAAAMSMPAVVRLHGSIIANLMEAPRPFAVVVLPAHSEILVPFMFEARLVAGKFKDTPGVALQIGNRVKRMAKEHLPPIPILAIVFGAVKAVLDRAGDIADAAINGMLGAGFPRRKCSAVR